MPHQAHDSVSLAGHGKPAGFALVTANITSSLISPCRDAAVTLERLHVLFTERADEEIFFAMRVTIFRPRRRRGRAIGDRCRQVFIVLLAVEHASLIGRRFNNT